jgi:hypothetical protein
VIALPALLLAIASAMYNFEPSTGPVIRVGPIDAAMGLRAMTITLVNKDSTPRTVNGYPAVRVLGKDGQPLTITLNPGAKDVTTGFDTPPKPITLQPGQKATAVLAWRNTVTDSTVKATHGAYLDLATAAGQPWQTRRPEGGIDLGNTGTLGISAWTTP